MADEIRKPDGDLEDAFQYNPQEGLSYRTLLSSLVVVPGESDGPELALDSQGLMMDDMAI